MYRSLERTLVVDIGGGSTELVGRESNCSLAVGVGRPLRQRMIWPDLDLGRQAAMVGGTGRMLGLLTASRPFQTISIDVLRRAMDAAEAMGTSDLVKIGVPASRVELVRPGLEIVRSLVDHYRWTALFWSDAGLLEGLWLTASLGRGRNTLDQDRRV
jgi:hypothetical protein